MGAPNRRIGKKPSRGAMSDLGSKQVAIKEGAPPTAKEIDPHALEGATDIEVALH